MGCKSGYYWVNGGTCWEHCRNDIDAGALCLERSTGQPYPKKSYWPERVTNFDDKSKCDHSDQYKSGALCYKKCSTYGETASSLLDCGFDACSSDSHACQSTITNMASEVGMSIASIAALIATGGAAVPLNSAGKAMTNRMSAVAIRALQRSTVNGLRRSGKQMFKKASTKQGMNAFTKKHIVDAAKAGWTENMVKGMCNKIASSFYDKLNPNPAPFNVDWLDPTGIATAVTSCKDGALTDPEDTACKAAILSAMSTF